VSECFGDRVLTVRPFFCDDLYRCEDCDFQWFEAPFGHDDPPEAAE
jgi:hypothetical protein